MGAEFGQREPRDIQAAMLGHLPIMSHLAARPEQHEHPAGLGLASLAGATRRELGAALAEAGVPEREIRMRVAQLWHWIYHAGATSFDPMGNISKVLRGDCRRANFPRRHAEMAAQA